MNFESAETFTSHNTADTAHDPWGDYRLCGFNQPDIARQREQDRLDGVVCSAAYQLVEHMALPDRNRNAHTSSYQGLVTLFDGEFNQGGQAAVTRLFQGLQQYVANGGSGANFELRNCAPVNENGRLTGWTLSVRPPGANADTQITILRR